MGHKQDLVSQDPQVVVGALLSLQRDNAIQQDTSLQSSDAIQLVLGQQTASPAVRQLAYQVLMTSPLSDGEWTQLIPYLAMDMAGAHGEEAQQGALLLMSTAPDSQLPSLLWSGETASALSKACTSPSAGVRSEAYASIGSCLSRPSVLERSANANAGGASEGTAAQLFVWMALLADGLADFSPTAATGALEGMAAFLRATLGAAGSSVASLPPVAARLLAVAAARVGTGFSQVLHRLACLPSRVQVTGLGVVDAMMWYLMDPAASMEMPPELEEAGSQLELLRLTNPSCLVDEFGSFLFDAAAEADAGLRLAAAVKLLTLCRRCAEGGTVLPASLSSTMLFRDMPVAWLLRAREALMTSWQVSAGDPGRQAVLEALAGSIPVLPMALRMQTVHSLLGMLVSLDSAAARVAVLTLLWRRMVDLCCNPLQPGEEAEAEGEEGLSQPGGYLMRVFEHAEVKSIMNGSAQYSNAEMQDSVDKGVVGMLQQEMVATLIMALLNHPETERVERFCSRSRRPAGPAPGGDAAGADPRAGGSDAEQMAAAAAGAGWSSQGTMVMNWMASAVIALQACQVCLGWSVEARGKLTLPCTLPQDLWLLLLQRAGWSCRLFLQHLGIDEPHSAMEVFAPGGAAVADGGGGGGGGEGGLSPPAGAADGGAAAQRAHMRMVRTIAAASISIDEMVAKTLQHWQSMGVAVRPRALWVAVHSLQHLRLQVAEAPAAGKRPGGRHVLIPGSVCSNLMRAAHDLLVASPALANDFTRTELHRAAAAGRMPFSSSAAAAGGGGPGAADGKPGAAAGSAAAADGRPEAKAGPGQLLSRRAAPPPPPAANVGGPRFLPAKGDSVEAEMEGIQVGLAVLDHITDSVCCHVATLEAAGAEAAACSAMVEALGSCLQATQASQHADAPVKERCSGTLRRLSDARQRIAALPAAAAGGADADAAAAAIDDGTVVRFDAALAQHHGYPFAGPLSSALAGLERAERHQRLLAQLVHPALALGVQSEAASAGERLLAAMSESLADSSVPTLARGLASSLDTTAAGGPRMVEVTAASDPIRIFLRHEVEAESLRLTVLMRVVNTLETGVVDGASVRLLLEGPIVPNSKRANAALRFQLPAGMAAGDEANWSCKLRFHSPGSAAIIPVVEWPLAIDVTGRRASVAAARYAIPLISLLQPPATAAPGGRRRRNPASSAASFFQELPTWSACAEASGVCTVPGARGAAALLATLRSKPFSRVWCSALPGTAGFQAAYRSAVQDTPVGMVVVAQLLPMPAAEQLRATSSAEAAAAPPPPPPPPPAGNLDVNGNGNGDADGDGEAPPPPTEAPAPTGWEVDGAQWTRLAVRVVVRSPADVLVRFVQDYQDVWLAQLTDGLVVPGLGSEDAGLPASSAQPLPVGQHADEDDRAVLDALLRPPRPRFDGAALGGDWVHSGALQQWQQLRGLA